MRRKLVRVGKSTLMLSMPRRWIEENRLGKGDEVEIAQDDRNLSISAASRSTKERLRLDITDYKGMTARLVYSLYRMGIDEIELTSRDPGLIAEIKKVIWKEAIGLEIVEETKERCVLTNVSGMLESMPNLVNRLFFLTLTMGDETVSSIRKGSGAENVLYLEQENNRITTLLIRQINKYGAEGFAKTGPVYFLVQELEKIGDQYKYLAQYLLKNSGRQKPDEKLLAALESSNTILRQVFQLYSDFRPKTADAIKQSRELLVSSMVSRYSSKLSPLEIAMVHHLLNICQISFDMIPSIFILRVT